MNIDQFVSAVSQVSLPGVFNPYREICPIHDSQESPLKRKQNLRLLLRAVELLQADTVWMGRDLGFRGGRRTGIPLTDEAHLSAFPATYSGASPQKATCTPAIAERTAAEIWAVLRAIDRPPLLWNAFPLHPFEAGNPLSNRRFTARELAAVSEINRELLDWLRPRRVVALGEDAAKYATKFTRNVTRVRHPSYGGTLQFRREIGRLYQGAGRLL